MNKNKGISLILLIITVIVVIILATVVILTLKQNDIITNSKTAVVLSEINDIRECINLISTSTNNEANKISGKLSDFDELSDYVKKYNDILYIKNNKLCLNFISTIESGNVYKNNKYKVDILKEKLDVCYDSIKENNKVTNPSFDDGLNGYQTRSTNGDIAEVKNENGNNYLHMEMYKSSGSCQLITFNITKAANEYGEIFYAFERYRNSYAPNEDGFKINNSIIVLSKNKGGFDQTMLSKTKFLENYNTGWQSVSCIRTIENNHQDLGLCIRFGGSALFGQVQEYSIDFDDVYVINLTELFGKGNEPSKNEMDKIFSNINF